MQLVRRIRNRLTALRILAFTSDERLRRLVGTLKSANFDFRQFEETIGYRPRDWRFFFQALLHRSYLQFVDGYWGSNERLEFLGDSILNFIVADHLYRAYPNMEEGNLTKVRSRLVNRRILAQRSKDLRMLDFLLLSTSAAQSVEGGSDSILSDAYESVVGALYLDGGFKPACAFVHRTILSNQEVIASAMTDDNYKSALLEYAQAHGFGTPRYTVVKEEGPEHDRRFTIEVAIGSSMCGVGTGRSKKEAEQAAAAQALDQLHTHPHLIQTDPP
ncbi:MAG: ribonuclease III [Bacteroidetes bacterium]|nr:ribonuclease III [Bacteroidota bacterium]